MSEGPPLRVERRDDGVAVWTMDRPARFNPLSDEMLGAFEAAVAGVDADVRAVVIAAEGRAFCAGHDLREMRANHDEVAHRALFARCSAFMQSLIALPVPVIAKVQGLATAAGCQLVATCDMALASDEARFAVSGVGLGLFCSTPAVALSRAIGRKRAFEMLTTGAFVDAHAAAEWGLVNRAVPSDELDAAVEVLLGLILAKSPVPIRMGKALFHRQLGMDLPEAYADAGAVMAKNMMVEDAEEGIDAFLAKRKPQWRGR